MALFDGEDEQRRDADSTDEWDAEPSESAESTHPDPAVGNDGAAEHPDLDSVTLHEGGPSGTLKRAVDPEAGVVVYAYKNGRAGGLSTVPLSETDLDGESRE